METVHPCEKRRRHFEWGVGPCMGLWRRLVPGLVITALAHHASAGQCAFRQTCVGSLDGNCTPEPTDSTVFPNGTFANASFPLDLAHGFGVSHDGVWNGDMADSSGRCADLAARADPSSGQCVRDGLVSAPVVCPEYSADGCCTWQQNYVLYQNLKTLVATFGGAQGCTACAVNLVNLWCALICSPDQSSFLQVHDPPFATRRDDLTNLMGVKVLQVDVWLEPSYACELFDSCKSTNIVGSVTGMQSGLGLLTYQAQTGAVGHGEYFFLHFNNKSMSAKPKAKAKAKAPPPRGLLSSNVTISISPHGTTSTTPLQPQAKPAPEPLGVVKKSLYRHATLACSSFYDPGAPTVPFPYPPPTNTLTQCSCTYCSSSCSSSSSSLSSLPKPKSGGQPPIKVTEGLNWALVLGAYAGIAALLATRAAVRWGLSRRAGASRHSRRGLLSSSQPLLQGIADNGDGEQQQQQGEGEEEEGPSTNT